MIRMADSAESAALPAGLPAYASYVDGHIGDQPNRTRVGAAFPGAHHLSIALFAGDYADCLDVEPGAAVASDVPAWQQRQRGQGVQRPCVYASVAAMRDEVLPVLALAGIARASMRLWTAHYGQGEHICGPGTCGELPTDADGTQWTDAFRAPGGVVDMSALRDDFFGDPSAWMFSAVRALAAPAVGPHSVRLTWSSPGIAAPAAVHHYQVTVRRDGEDLPSYPRDVPKGTNPESHQFGSLEPETVHEAMVRAVTADGSHASPWASVTFRTPSA